ADEFVASLGHALFNLAWPLFLAGCLVRLISHGRIAKLLDWTEGQRDQIRTIVRRTIAVVIPLLFVLLLAEAQYSELPRNTIGRLAFALLMIVAIAAARRLWRTAESPGRREGRESNARNPRGMAVMRLVTMAVPVALLAASISGYHYTALQFARR